MNIEDRNPQEYPQGVIYKLKGELVIPQIDASDINAIFEEHRIVRSLNSFQHIADVKRKSLRSRMFYSKLVHFLDDYGRRFWRRRTSFSISKCCRRSNYESSLQNRQFTESSFDEIVFLSLKRKSFSG